MDSNLTDQVSGDPATGLPSRGSILCVFTDNDSVEAYEAGLSGSGFTLVRARHGMHGYWLAVTSQPDVIVTDLIQPNDESSYLLDCLRRNVKTKNIPVVAIVDQVEQRQPGLSCLRAVAACFLKSTRTGELIAALDRLIATQPQPHSSRSIDHASRFDAFFADLGHATPKAHWATDANVPGTASSAESRVKSGKPSIDPAHRSGQRGPRPHRQNSDANASLAERLGARPYRTRD